MTNEQEDGGRKVESSGSSRYDLQSGDFAGPRNILVVREEEHGVKDLP